MELKLWKQFDVFKKVRNISRFNWDRQSRLRDYHLSLHALGKVKTIQPRAAQICKAKFGHPLSSSGVFKQFETRQQKKIGVN